VSDVIVVASTTPHHSQLDGFAEALSIRLAPTGVSYTEPTLHRSPGLLTAVIDPLEPGPLRPDFSLPQLRRRHGSPLGHIWCSVRDGEVTLENDIVGSRTLWVGHSAGIALATTSLRAAIFALGSFQLDERAWGWFLPSGMLGSSLSWDRRVKQVPPLSRVVLRPGMHAQVSSVSDERERATSRFDTLGDALTTAVGSLIPDERWALPLSGGLDSRALALLLPGNPRTVTWGDRVSENVPGSDAWVAARLASQLRLRHEFLPLDEDQPEPTVAIRQFVARSDGRTDNIRGYVDGGQLWSQLRASGIRGIIRGDQMFGDPPRPTERAVRRAQGLIEWNDLDVLRRLGAQTPSSWCVSQARLPPRRPDESVTQWNDRIRQSVVFPAGHAPLTQIKSRFVEVANPFLSEEVVRYALHLPRQQRRDRHALRVWLNQHSPQVPFATEAALAPTAEFLRRPSVIELIRAALHSEEAVESFPKTLLADVGSGLAGEGVAMATVGATTRSRIQRAKSLAPRNLRRWAAYRDPRFDVTMNQLGFRILLGIEAIRMLGCDADAGRNT
jgi:hypothetical protein